MVTNPDQMLEEVNKLIFVKRYSEAEALIWRLVNDESYSNRELALLRHIELSVKLGTIANLKKIYEENIKKNPEDPVMQTALVLVEQHAEMLSALEASTKFGELLKKYGGSASIYYGIGFCMEASGNFDRALYNYEHCINQDPSFYPGYFGLSQVYYQINEDSKGDYYFHIFEENAPYNVYGNFETHRRLSHDFLKDERYEDAELAIRTLSEWWAENKGTCPPEIQIYEKYCLSRILETKGDPKQATLEKSEAASLVRRMLIDESVDTGVLYFIAKTLEEFSEFELALSFYKKILTRENVSGEMIQKIGSQFLSLGEYELSLLLFEEAYQHHPNNTEIRFCLLVSRLRLANVNVEDYLLQKERMKQLVSNSSDRVELLSILHNLVAKFDSDPEVHHQVGEVYLRLGNIEKARQHLKKMFDIDPLSRSTALRYAAFEMQNGDPEKTSAILSRFENDDDLPISDRNEINWLRASFSLREKDYAKCRQYLAGAIASDPWNVSFLTHDAVCLIKESNVPKEKRVIDKTLQRLLVEEEDDLKWDEYDRFTDEWYGLHQYELAYTRDKIHFLYSEKDDKILSKLVKRSGQFDAQRGTYDFLRLLNTNFDGPEIYWALGMLCKESWQLETACVWFDQILMLPPKHKFYRGKAFLELADCYVWRDQKYEKAIEYVKVAMSLGERGEGRALTILAHALLRLGRVKQAELYLNDIEFSGDIEASYLKGLLHYRNGLQSEANTIWKPLLTIRSDNLRFHNIKQEILKYYFEKSPYLGAN